VRSRRGEAKLVMGTPAPGQLRDAPIVESCPPHPRMNQLDLSNVSRFP
jgi:hypothetical protein